MSLRDSKTAGTLQDPYIHWYYENVVWRQVDSLEEATRIDYQCEFARKARWGEKG